ncbi:uncharacterized protein Ecym_2137 [Eremothecium cymbalariae DBVPG|uniref:GTPase-activating protein GYP5 n=1 Tax=Eremothecium cymbalariae (strain CBS 270.75 / DBVPG 7215 / KCTC 17166 / NRRL Y-17582) TaxID=931890 RepID=G8JNH3_ERECY|nr:Hypothetical protein Ecym_2137 [Eremothecium cymbalariae DBVPG\
MAEVVEDTAQEKLQEANGHMGGKERLDGLISSQMVEVTDESDSTQSNEVELGEEVEVDSGGRSNGLVSEEEIMYTTKPLNMGGEDVRSEFVERSEIQKGYEKKAITTEAAVAAASARKSKLPVLATSLKDGVKRNERSTGASPKKVADSVVNDNKVGDVLARIRRYEQRDGEVGRKDGVLPVEKSAVSSVGEKEHVMDEVKAISAADSVGDSPKKRTVHAGNDNKPELPTRGCRRETSARAGASLRNHNDEGDNASSAASKYSEVQRTESSDFDLIINRLHENAQEFMSQDEKAQETVQEGARQLKSSYSEFLQTINKLEHVAVTEDGRTDEDAEIFEELTKLDWQFWTQVVNNFASVAKNDSVRLEQEISNGIPEPIRGIIWQLISNSKSKEIKQLYHDLLQIPSEHEKAIQRDISRTKFIPSDKVDSLFNVLKAYSLFDPEVGYTQGMAFVTAPLLLNVPEESDAIGLLIKLMKNYGLREFFLPDMPGLQLKLYQFDRLLEENSPILYNHLIRQGIRSSMYATQWFLTLFAYKFPLGFVLRILDVVFVEGIESLLKFSLILMLKNESTLVQLKFDKLLDFLKDGLFCYYLKENVKMRKEGKEAESAMQTAESGDSTSKSSIVGSEIIGTEYDVNVFIQDAIQEVKITPIQLRRYSSEYEEIHQLECQREAQYEEMRIKNRQLQREVRKLEHDYTLLNREHIMLANELIQNRLRIETLNDENQDLKSTIELLKQHIANEMRRQSLPNPDAEIPTNLKEDLEKTMQRNLEVMNQNQDLEDKIAALEKEIELLKANTVIHTEKQNQESVKKSPTSLHAISPSIGSWTFKKPW